jgi:hypothetical protein
MRCRRRNRRRGRRRGKKDAEDKEGKGGEE